MGTFLLIYIAGFIVASAIILILETKHPSGVDGEVLFFIACGSWVSVLAFIVGFFDNE